MYENKKEIAKYEYQSTFSGFLNVAKPENNVGIWSLPSKEAIIQSLNDQLRARLQVKSIVREKQEPNVQYFTVQNGFMIPINPVQCTEKYV